MQKHRLRFAPDIRSRAANAHTAGLSGVKIRPMKLRLRRWQLVWALTMAVAFVAGGLYIRKNLPPRPGVYWLMPYPSTETLADVQRRAEADPGMQAAFRKADDARRAMVLRGLAIWILSGAVLYGAGSAMYPLGAAR